MACDLSPRPMRVRHRTHKKAPCVHSARGFGRSFGDANARGVILSVVSSVTAGSQCDDQFIAAFSFTLDIGDQNGKPFRKGRFGKYHNLSKIQSAHGD